ncbi:hypothetical protein [Arthrobacter sp. MAHUQ-56]
MKSKLNAWAFLRPLLLAVAVAASWVALSAAGASADSSTSSDPLLGVAGSTLSSVTSTAGLADQLVQAVPAVNTAVPEGTVAAAVDPAVDTVDRIVGGTVGTAVPVAGAVLEPLQPVLDPVIDAVPLPVVTPAAPPTSAPALPAAIPLPGEGAPYRAAEPQQANAGPEIAAPSPSRRMLHNTGLACDPRLRPAAAALAPGAGPGDAPFRTPSDPSPAVPGAAGGSNSSGGNDPAAPAWICPHRFPAAGAGTAAAQGRLLAPPAPVSFDPGSSPD